MESEYRQQKHTAKVKSRREHSMPGQGMHVAKPGNSGMRMAVTTISKYWCPVNVFNALFLLILIVDKPPFA